MEKQTEIWTECLTKIQRDRQKYGQNVKQRYRETEC